MFFLSVVWVCINSYGQSVTINLPSEQLGDPLAALQVHGPVRIDTMPPTTTPTHVLVLDVANDSIIHSIPFAAFVSLISQSISTSVPIVRTYTTNAVWTKPPGLKYIIIEMVGGGGGGGGCYGYGGGAGAAGGYTRKIIAAASLSTNETITIGAAGMGGAPQFPGGDGGTTAFGSHCSATGGQGGKAQTTTVNTTDGSVGGVGVSGDINSNGSPGAGATSSGQPIQFGASSYFGGGAVAIAQETSGNGFSATGYGSGGSGGNGNGNPNKNGGNGSNGIVLVTEYY